MRTSVELTEKELKELVYQFLSQKLGELDFNEDDVKIEVKSKQNYRSEWESASFRARLEIYK